MNIIPIRFTREVIAALALGTILSYVLHLVLLPLLGKHVSMPYTFTCGLIYAGILLAISFFAAKQAAHMQRVLAHEALMQEIEVAERVQQLQRACHVSGITVADIVQFQKDLQQSCAK